MGQYVNRLRADLERRLTGECRVVVLWGQAGQDPELAEKQLRQFRNALKYQSGRRGTEYACRTATGADKTGQCYHWLVVKSAISDDWLRMLWAYGPVDIGRVRMDEGLALHMAHRMAVIDGEEAAAEAVAAGGDGCLFRNGYGCCGEFDCLHCVYGLLSAHQETGCLQADATREDKPCRDNPGLHCGGVGCGSCGWNPEVEQRRKRKIRERWG